jgi:hypothetical protein
VALRYSIRGHEVVVRALDFTQPWQAIHDALLALPFEFGKSPRSQAASGM